MPASIARPPGLLCVGGPYAGKIVATRYGNPKFVASKPVSLREAPFSAGYRSPQTEPIETAVYTMQSWATDHGQVEVWAPEGQAYHTTLRLLLAAYEANPVEDLTLAGEAKLKEISNA